MANPTTKQVRNINARPAATADTRGGELAALVSEFNVFVTQLRVLTAKLDADSAVSDTDYAALVTDLGVGPATITLLNG